jgi:biopolymer transport protein ExbD
MKHLLPLVLLLTLSGCAKSGSNSQNLATPTTSTSTTPFERRQMEITVSNDGPNGLSVDDWTLSVADLPTLVRTSNPQIVIIYPAKRGGDYSTALKVQTELENLGVTTVWISLDSMWVVKSEHHAQQP